MADVIVGAPLYDDAYAQEGRGLVYYGNGGAGLALRPRQVRADGSAPIAPLGVSDSTEALQLRLTGRMPLGREKVRLEWQVAPLGVPFTAIHSAIAPGLANPLPLLWKADDPMLRSGQTTSSYFGLPG